MIILISFIILQTNKMGIKRKKTGKNKKQRPIPQDFSMETIDMNRYPNSFPECISSINPETGNVICKMYININI